MENNISTLFGATLVLIACTIVIIIYLIQAALEKIYKELDKLSLEEQKEYKKHSLKRKSLLFFNNVLGAIFIVLFLSCFAFAFFTLNLNQNNNEEPISFIFSLINENFNYVGLISLVILLIGFIALLIDPEFVINLGLRMRGIEGGIASKEAIKFWRKTALCLIVITLMGIFIYFLRYVWGYDKAINEFIGDLFNKILLNF